MLKSYYLLLFVLAIGTTTTLSAQITLTAENYGVQDSVILNDTLYYEGAFAPDIPMGGENQTWDYSAVQADSLISLTFFPVPEEDTCFLGAQTLRPINFAFQAFEYPGTGYTSYEEGGRFNLGFKTDGAKFPLTAITGNPMDTLDILPRISPARETLIPFPATFGTIAQDTFVQTAPLEITVSAFGLNRTPAAQIFTTTNTVEVIGYGNLILPELAGVSSQPLEALLARVTTVEVANYTLAGGPAPAALLQAFGVSQNETNTTVNYFFHVEGVGRSVARLVSINGNYRFEFRKVPPMAPSSVDNLVSLEPLQFSPNPVRPGEVLQLTTPVGVSDGMLRLLDIQGRTVAENSFRSLPGDNINFRIPATVMPGLYIQQVLNERGQLVSVGKVLVQ